MLEQPAFGRRLKVLRKERGLSQVSVAGDGMSTGYLSRLESGARQPTVRAVAYLAERLRVHPSAFAEPTDQPVIHALTLAVSAENDEALQEVAAALERSPEADAALRWQALWLLSGAAARRGELAEEAALLKQLKAAAEELDLPGLRSRARTRLARCLRLLGEVTGALEVAQEAYRLALNYRLPVRETGLALLALVSVEAEAGQLASARAHADELVALAEGRADTLRAEALQAAAAVSLRQGDAEAARLLLEQAMKEFDSHVDLVLWMSLRLSAASLHLQLSPPWLAECRRCLDEAQPALALVGTPQQCQEMLMLRAHLAFAEGRYAEARAAHDELVVDGLGLAYRDRTRLDILHNRLLILENQDQVGIRQLRQLGEQVQRTSHVDLAAEIWRALAETLAAGRGADTEPQP
ncbi:transcriptional regulator [Streptomyces sp. WAC 05379]|nr:transcriptional regulator [Streptomyces sp. WAC 05379]